MAIVTGPLFSLTGRQSVGKTLVFYRSRGLNVTRQWVKPKNPQTPAQIARRDLFQDAAAFWRSHDLDKPAWQLLANQTPSKYTSYSAFMQSWLAVAALDGAQQAFVGNVLVTANPLTPFDISLSGAIRNLDGTLNTTINPILSWGPDPSCTEGSKTTTNTAGALSCMENMPDHVQRYAMLTLPGSNIKITGVLTIQEVP